MNTQMLFKKINKTHPHIHMIPFRHWLILSDSTIFGGTPTSKAMSGIFLNKLDPFFHVKRLTNYASILHFESK